MNPKDYVWGTPTALPGAGGFAQFAGAGYVCAPGNAPYGQPPLQHSASLPNLYPTAVAHEGVFPIQDDNRSILFWFMHLMDHIA
jgi:hypothetical protein